MAISSRFQVVPNKFQRFPSMLLLYCSLLAAVPFSVARLPAQAFPTPLDPSRSVELNKPLVHPTLREEYIWTSGDVTALRSDRNKFPWNAVLATCNLKYSRPKGVMS